MSENNKPKTKLIKLDGTLIKSDGSTYKSDFFKFLELNPDDYSDIAYTPEEANKIRAHLMFLSTGASAAVPMICFLPDSQVVMGDGTLKCIQDLCIGDEVYTHKGRIRKVKKVLKNQTSQAVFSFRIGNKGTRQWSSWCTGEHPFYLPKSCSWLEAANLTTEHSVLAPFYSFDHKEELSNKDWAWATLLGYYLAEGSGQANKKDKHGRLSGDSVDFTFHIKEKKYESEIKRAADILSLNKPRVYLYPEKKVRLVRINGKEPIKTLISLGGKYSHQKKLHSDVLYYWPYKKLLRLFKCYLNGDGHFRNYRKSTKRMMKPEWSWKTVSKKLSEQLHTVALMLQLIPARPTFYDPPKRKRTYCGYMSGMSVENLNQEIKQENKYVQFKKEGVHLKVNKIKTKFYTGMVYNLEVEEDNSYCVDWIAVHNCGGIARCPMASRCPFIKIDEERKKIEGPKCKKVTPIGRACLVEYELLNEWTRLYLYEYDVAEGAFTEVQMCRELAELELLLWRINNGLAKPENAELIQDVTVGTDKEGNVLTRQETSALYNTKERIQNRKSKLIKLMVGDRQEKYKREAALKVRDVSDPSTQTAQLRGRLTRLLDEAKKIDIKIKEAEGDVIDVELDNNEIITPEDLIGSDKK